MNTIKIRNLFVLKLCLFLFVALMFPATALARGSAVEDTVDDGEVIDQNLVLAGPEVVMAGEINGDLAAVGDQVTISGEVNGSLLVIGRSVILNGPVSGSLFVSALTLVVGPEASVGRDVHFIGEGLETQAGSTIERDLHVISLESSLSGEVNRKVNALVGPRNLILAMIDFMQSRGLLPQDEPPGANLPAFRLASSGNENLEVLGMGFGLPSIQSLPLFQPSPEQGTAANAGPGVRAPRQETTLDVPRIQAWALAFLRTLLSLLILGLLWVWLLPAQLSWAGEQARQGPLRAIFNGFVVFSVGWIGVFLGLVLVIVLAIFLYWVSLPNLAFLTGALGLTGLGLVVSVFWLSITYFSKLIIAFLVGTLLLRRFFPRYAQSRIWPLLVGVVLYALLASIPYLGWLVAVLFTLAGLGALWVISFPKRLAEGKPAPLAQSLPDSPRPA
jgi:hypothetical protein